MNEYSESWRHLKALLAGYANKDSEVRAPSYEDQRHAKALSIFLTHADLATPCLNRDTVKAVLAGRLQWPRTEGGPYLGTDIPLSRLEELGLVSFYAGWCATHANPVRDETVVDPTLIPIIEAIEHLKDILRGRNGCVRPHYACDEGELKSLLQAEFGDRISVEKLLPELELDGDIFRLMPGNQNFCAEISTQLWADLRSNHAPEEAFSRWMMCFRVNCDWVMPVIFDRLQYEGRKEFHDLLLNFLADDPALSTSVDCFVRQSINEHDFSGHTQLTEIHRDCVIDQNTDRSESTTSEKELPRPTLSSLEEIDSASLGEASSAFEFVIRMQSSRLREKELFYSWLVSTVVEASIRIETAHLASSGLVEKLVDLANDHRPVLKYLLYVVLPNYNLPNYMILLLALKETSDVAFFHLAKRNFERSRDQDTAYLQNIADGYHQLLCREYIRAIQNEPDFLPRFVSVLKKLGEECAFHSPDFFKGLEYRLLLTLLSSLADQQVSCLAQAFAELSFDVEGSRSEQTRQHFKYLLGFWLIDRIERTGIDPTEATCEAVREYLRALYKVEFSANLTALRSLEPSSFFGALSWKQLFAGKGQDFMLNLSSLCDEWPEQLERQNRNAFGFALAVRHYLQVLISVGRASSDASAQQVIARRVYEIIRICGFKKREKYVRLFEGFGSDRLDLWQQVCDYSNSFTDELYKDFIVRCAPSIPLNLLFALLERTSVIARVQQLHDTIDRHPVELDGELDLQSIEDAFTSAFNTDRTEIASRMLSAAKKKLAEDRFDNAISKVSIRVRKVWQSYDYKAQLLELYEIHKDDPARFQTLANELPPPHDWHASPGQSDDRAHHNECDFFKRQVIATAFCDKDPSKSVRIMDALYRESKRKHHGFVLLHSHVKLFAVNQNKPALKSALTTFLKAAGMESPDRMDEYWVATVLEAFQLSGAPGVDHFWTQLSPEQQGRRLIFSPYCRALIARRDSFTVKKILARYKEINHETLDELEIDDLLSELIKIEKDAPSTKDFCLIMAESSQRSVVQLQKHYNQIIAKDFESYVEVVNPDQAPHEYIREAMLAVAGELVLRKRNLQVATRNQEGSVSFQGMKLENWVNDWFVSLFDQRMSHAKLSLRDQKRGGYSSSGKGPGEIDGFITSSDNKRIGIFEAFRLFSVDTNVIREHFNKLAGYDGESLSPVVMVGYCDVKNFSKLVSGYKDHVSKQTYSGYTAVDGKPGVLETLRNEEHIWSGSEIRRRGHKDIVFYHLLINLHFSPAVVSTDDGEQANSSK